MYNKCAKSLQYLLNRMEWEPDVLGKPLSSTMIGFHTNGVLEDVRDKSKILLSQNQFSDDNSKYWKYDTPNASVFNGYHSMKLNDNVTPHKHQLEVIEQIHDRVNKKYTVQRFNLHAHLENHCCLFC